MKLMFHGILFLTVLTLLASCGSQPDASDTVTAPLLEQRARDFVSQLAAAEYRQARQHFTTTMKLTLSGQKLEEIWQSLQQQAGGFIQQGEASIQAEQGYQVVYITCRFGLSALDVKVVFDKKGQIAGLFFQPAEDSTAMAPEYQAPAYADPELFREEEVVVGVEDWPLSGTLSLPNGDGPFPAVVLVHGSGPNDRDETLGPNRVFKDLAWGLTSRGIAVLRYEKRTREFADSFTPAQMQDFTVQEEVIDDALAAVAWLEHRPEIDPERVFVAGHSLGATLAPRIASQSDSLAGIVLLAAAARPVEDLMLEQSQYLASADGNLDRAEKAGLKDLQELVEQVKALPQAADYDPEELILGAAPAYWLDLAGYNPLSVAADLSMPMLILQGERDYQVTMTDFALWQDALGNRSNVTFRSYPALNHLFLAGEGPSLPAEYQHPGHVDLAVIEDITAFIVP